MPPSKKHWFSVLASISPVRFDPKGSRTPAIPDVELFTQVYKPQPELGRVIRVKIPNAKLRPLIVSLIHALAIREHMPPDIILRSIKHTMDLQNARYGKAEK